MKASIRQIGNSYGVIIPKPILAQVGLTYEAEMTVENETIVLRKPIEPVRAGWGEAARRIAAAGDDALVMGDVGNIEDEDLQW
jgi:antitoxin MazE